MRYSLVDTPLAEQSTPCLVTSLKTAKSVARTLGSQDLVARATRDFKDSAEQTLVVPLDGRIARLLIVGGADGTVDEDGFRKLCRAAAAALTRLPVKQALVSLDHVRVKGGRDRSAFRQKSVMQAISLAAYRYNRHKSTGADTASLTNVRLHVADKRNTGNITRLGNALDRGLGLARDLGNEPPNVCNPTYVLREARKLGKNPNVTVSSFNEKKMGELGMGAFLAVSQGSATPGHMITIQYRGGRKSDAPYALVGKGITFDTGGISLKPGPAMDEMKFDMCGAAAVLGATLAVIEAKLPINLVTVVAAAENMPSGDATRPGDIVTTASGKTVEILNTDAEGRLVLCDALTHVQTFKPQAIIDVATLTGAQVIALGSPASAVYANDDKLADALLAAGQRTGDKAWRMPLWDEYQVQLKSNFADFANIGGREAGSITAACFLSRFIDGVDWAHMDVAGSAFRGGAQKGATGRPVPLLFDYLCQAADR